MDKSMFPLWLRPSLRVFNPAQRLFDEMSRFFSERGILIQKNTENKVCLNEVKIFKKQQTETKKRNCEYEEFDLLNNPKRKQNCKFKESDHIEFNFLVILYFFGNIFCNFRVIILI